MKLPEGMGNILSNTIITSCNFVVNFEGLTIGFQSVSGLEQDNEYRYINEGGRNDYPLKLKQPRSSPHRLTFKRGIPISSSGVAGVLSEVAKYKIFEQENMIGFIFVMGNNRDVEVMYSFISQGKIEHQYSDLDAMGNDVLFETMTITHKGLHRIFVPF